MTMQTELKQHLTTNGHLTEDQIDDALLGDLAAAAAVHLEGCGACRERLAEARMPLESFKAVTLAWSERRSATLPVSLRERVLQNAAGSRRLAWGSVAAAVLVAAVVAPVTMRQSGKGPNGAGAVETAQVRTERAMGTTGVVSGQLQHSDADAEQIDRDNQMLNEIDRELNSNSDSPAVLGLQEVQVPAHRHGGALAVQD